MKTIKLMRFALYAAILATLSLVGCEKLDLYSIDAPSNLQYKIDSIAAARAGMNTGDTTYMSIATPLVGAEDFSNAWWTTFSDGFTIPSNKLLHLEFVNNNSGIASGNYQNWCLAVTNMAGAHSPTDNAAYAEYFVLRADAWGWSGAMTKVDPTYAFNIKMVANDYPDTDGDGDVWNDFRTHMNGAYVYMDIDHSATGNVYVKVSAVKDGKTITMTYNQPVSATDDIAAFLVCEVSYLKMKKAYLLPSKVTVVKDENPVSITVAGVPTAVELGNEDYWGAGKATVTFADNSTIEAPVADITFSVIPDMKTLGKKTVVLVYNKSKQGKYTSPVSTIYTLSVTNPLKSLAVTTNPTVTTYTFPGTAAPLFDPTGMVVTGTYSDGTTAVIPNESLQFKNPGGNGAKNAIISYVGATATVTTTCPITNVVGATNRVGASDFSSAWWTAFSNKYSVASGATKTFTMKCYSTGANNWNAPLVILRKANMAEYAVVRMDNYGWGDNYNADGRSNDWDFAVLAQNINNSTVKIAVTNLGDGKAKVRYTVTYATGEVHFQEYSNIAIDANNLNATITIDGCYVDITSVE